MNGSFHLSCILAGLISVSNCSITVVTVTAAPSIPSNEPSFSDAKSFTSAILNSTNFYRQEHNATAVTWNSTLESFASSYISSNNCNFAHSGGPYGENLAIGYPNATASVEAWGNERDEYDFNNPGFSEQTGHFTQLVWRNTTDVGCGRRLCGTKGWYLVCEYWPRGNVEGEYKQEVDREVSVAAALAKLNAWGVLLCVLVGICLWA